MNGEKKQSTLEFYSDIYPYLSEFSTKITDIFGNGYVTPDDVRYTLDEDIQQIIYEYLVTQLSQQIFLNNSCINAA